MKNNDIMSNTMEPLQIKDTLELGMYRFFRGYKCIVGIQKSHVQCPLDGGGVSFIQRSLYLYCSMKEM